MKAFFEKHSNSFVAAILTFVVTLLAVAVSSFCFFNGHMDIPLGFLLGGGVMGGLNLLSALAEKADEKRQSTTFSILVITLRLTLLVGIAIIIAFMYYRWNLPIFNLYTFIAMYTMSVICTIIVHLVNKK